MNILFLTYQGDLAGSTHSISYLASGLAAKGHQIFVGCRKESMLYRLIENSMAKPVPMTFGSRFSIANILQIRDAVNRWRIQIINAQSSYDRYTSVFAKFLFRLPVKVVHTRRQISASVGGFLQNLVYVKGADLVIAVSQAVKTSLIRNGIPNHHIQVVYNGTPASKYDAVDPHKVAGLKMRFNLERSDFVIGCVSRMKRQEQILKALSLLPFRTKVIFVGIKPWQEASALLDPIKDRHDINFVGEVTAVDALNFYKIFSVKILPSTIEGLSQSLMEAMTLGVPVIATNYGGNPELIQHGVNGFLFEDNNIQELAEQIIQLYNQPGLAEKLAKNGRSTVLRQFMIEKTIEHYEEVFSDLLADRMKSPGEKVSTRAPADIV